MKVDSQYKFSPERESRVADALRENLRKRKQQQAQTRVAETDQDKDAR
jgi:hypothetical protein